MSVQANEKSCFLQCIGGTAGIVYVGYQLTKELITKGIPSMSRELIRPLPAAFREIKKGGKQLAIITKTIVSPLLKKTSAVVCENVHPGLYAGREISKVVNFSKKRVILGGKTVLENAGEVFLENVDFIKTGGKESLAYLNAGFTFSARAMNPNSYVGRNCALLVQEIIFYPKAFKCGDIPSSNLQQVITHSAFSAVKEPFYCLKPSFREGRKTLKITWENTAEITAVCVRKSIIPFISEQGEYPACAFKEVSKGGVLAFQATGQIVKGVYNGFVRPSFMELTSYGSYVIKEINKCGELLWTSSIKITRSMIEVGAVFPKELALSAAIAFWQTCHSVIYVLKLSTHLKKIEHIFRVMSECAIYIKPAFEECGKAGILTIKSLQFPTERFGKGVFASAEELVLNSKAALFESLEVISLMADVPKWGGYLKHFEDVFTVSSECAMYLKPAIGDCGKGVSLSATSLAFPLEQLTKNVFVGIHEILHSFVAAPPECLKGLISIGSGIRKGLRLPFFPTISITKEVLSYLSSTAYQLQHVLGIVVDNPDKVYVAEMMKMVIIELCMSFFNASKATASEGEHALEACQRDIDVVMPIVHHSGMIICEGLRYLPASAREIAKIAALLEEDFPSTIQHFIIDPAGAWWHYRKISLLETVEHIRQKFRDIRDELSNRR